MTKLKVGFIVDSTTVQEHVNELFNWVKLDKDNFQPPQLIIQRTNKKPNFLSFFKNLHIKVLSKVELFFVRKRKFHEKYRKLNTLDKDIPALDIFPKISKSGFVYRYDKDCINNIRKLDLDVLIRCGSGILKGEILSVTKFGILSLHHGDNRVYRGGPPGFWEVYENSDDSGFIIQKLNEELDGGEVLLRGNIQTKGFWHLNTSNLFKKANPFFFKLLKDISISNSLPEAEKNCIYDGKIYKNPNYFVLIDYILKTYTPKLKKIIENALRFDKRDTWEVSFGKVGANDLSLFRSKTIKNKTNRFFADPFICKAKGRNIIFVEDYFFSESKGKISAIEIFDDDSYKFIDIVLEEKFHLSFPYVFKHKEEIYMVPESSENKDVRLYECVEFPTKWKLKKILLKDISAVDSMVLHKDEKWFLITNLCSSSIEDHSSEMHLFVSDDFLNNEFTPVCSNPVIFDSKKARNGGIFNLNGVFYRTAQYQGKAHYGKSFSLNKIKSLNENIYQEETSHIVEPNFKNNIASTHHFHIHENYYVIDHLKRKYKCET